MQASQNRLVWARMRYCPFWPAKIVETPPALGKTPANKICVLFFGSKQFGFVDCKNIMEYEHNRERFIVKGRGSDFKTAVKNMDEYCSDPTRFRSHGLAKVSRNQMPIKTEREIELRLNIKTENKKPKIKTEPKLVKGQPSRENDLLKEKQALIQQIMSLKSESHRNVLALKRNTLENASLLVEKQKLVGEIVAQKALFTKQVNDLQTLLEQIQATSDEKIKHHEKTISDLKRENKSFHARITQFQTGMMQQTPNHKKN